MSIFIDENANTVSKATTTVHEEPRCALVCFRGQDGSQFRVKVHQKPNPIGFTASQPGGQVITSARGEKHGTRT